jgi:hypothetical protein
MGGRKIILNQWRTPPLYRHEVLTMTIVLTLASFIIVSVSGMNWYGGSADGDKKGYF